MTAKAQLQHQKTGKIDPLVDPAGFGVIRRSLPRFEPHGKKWRLAMPTPMPVEIRFDTTGSMGNNVDVAFDVLPMLYELLQKKVLSRYDLQIATGIFGDVADQVVLCRSQFEMDQKIAEQLTHMLPEGEGDDVPEDPHYGLFGAAYLIDAYINRVGLKGYDFTISDATMHEALDEATLIRVFGKEVFDKVAENGHQIDRSNLPSIHDMVQDMLTRTHAFFLQVGTRAEATKQWSDIMGADRVIVLPSVKLAPQVIAAVIGLTEGVLDLQSVTGFLTENEVPEDDAKRIARSVAGIPIGAQAALAGFSTIPMAGAIFNNKTDIWPISAEEAAEVAVETFGETKDWL